MKIFVRLAVAAIVVASVSGCVHTNAAMLGTASAQRPALVAEQVALYRVAAQVPRRYEEIAILNSKGDSGFTDEARMFESMKQKAGELGANGVILDAVSEPGHGAKVAAAIFGVSAQRKGKALAIYVFPDGHPDAVLPQAAASNPDAPTPPPVESCESCAKIGRGF